MIGRRQRTKGSRTPQPTAPPPWPGPYLGDSTYGPVCAGPQTSLLILGPPRSGKTSCVMIPNILAARGPVVSTSTKADVAEATMRARARRGRVWLFDPTGSLTLDDRTPLIRLRWSPVPGCENWDTALATARALVRAAQPGRGLLDATHWVERAEATLAPAASCGRASSTSPWPGSCAGSTAAKLDEPANILAHKGAEFAHDVLTGIAQTEERERSSILSTTSGVLAAYRSRAALEQADEPNFDPVAFAHSADTIYVAASAEAQEVAAPLVVALLERIRTAVYQRHPGWPPAVFALDEVANIAPIPSLPSIVSEGGGQGLVTIASLQDLSQARGRWGAAGEGFLTLFGAKLVLAGLADLRTLQLISALGGETDVPVTSTTRPLSILAPAGASSTTTWRRQPALPVDMVARGYPGAALAIHATSPVWVTLTPWWQEPWRSLAQ